MKGLKKLQCGKWRARATRVDPRTGKKREATKLCNTQREAIQALNELREHLELEALPIAKKRLCEYSAEWLAKRSAAKKSIARATVKKDAGIIRQWTECWIGEIFVDQLRPSDINRWIHDELIANRGLGYWQVHHNLKLMRAITKAAKVDYDLAIWACEGVSNPVSKPDYTDDDPNIFYTTEQAAEFLRLARQTEPQHYPLIALMMLTGLRTCEATALRWEDLQQEPGVLLIRRSQVNKDIRPTTKNKRRLRLPVTKEMLELFRLQKIELMRKGHPHSEWVFVNSHGELFCTGALQKPMDRLHKLSGMKYRIKPHGLRRTANNLLPHDIRKDIIGHLSDVISHDYSRASLDDKRGALKLLHGGLTK